MAMDNSTMKIRELAKGLLESGAVEKVIGFAAGTVPMATHPVAVSSVEDVDKLIFTSTCGLNLANYARQLKGKIAVVAKGCDSRNIVTHIVENQVKREDVHIIGVPCSGMVDKLKITAAVEGEVICFEEDGETIKACSATKEETFNKADILRDNCQLCTHRNPVLYDDLAGELVEEQKLDNLFPDVDRIEAMDADEKWAHFQALTENCIRCYACKNACPLCYCPTCFVDESTPQWVGKGQNKTDVDTFHVLRAFHCGGRCTDCGACVEACPMGINVRDFTRKLNKDALELFGWEAGLSTDQRPPLDAYSPEDPDDFIM